MKNSAHFLKNYAFAVLLIAAILCGSLLGLLLKERAEVFKPFGDIFLNLLFTAVVPLVFFSISSAVAGMSNLDRLKKIMIYMLLIFIANGLISASLMILGVKFYPPTVNINLTSNVVPEISSVKTPEQIVKAFTTPDFVDILSKKNMLPLILFSLLIGLGTTASGEKGRFFVSFLQSGSHVMMKVI